MAISLLTVRIDKVSKKAEEIAVDGMPHVVPGSRLHVAFKYGGDAATSHPILHDRMTFVILWIGGRSIGNTKREAAWSPATWGLFTLEGLSDGGEHWIAELRPVMHWSVSDSADELADIYASDFGDSY